jgi:hypothetical protein
MSKRSIRPARPAEELADRLHRAIRLIDHLQADSDPISRRFAAAMAKCMQSLRPDGEPAGRPFKPCKLVVCPHCAFQVQRKRYANFARAIEILFRVHPQTRALFVTLTLRPDETESLRESAKWLAARVCRLFDFFSLAGAVRTIEVTARLGVHAHVLVLVSEEALQDQNLGDPGVWNACWQSISNLSYASIIDLQEVRPTLDDVKRVFWYISGETFAFDPQISPPRAAATVVEQLYRFRRFETYGAIRRTKAIVERAYKTHARVRQSAVS